MADDTKAARIAARRAELEILYAQALRDVATARARLAAQAPAGWTSREP